MSTKDAFRQVYATRNWGTSQSDEPFYSGAGSEGSAAEEYCQLVSQFVRDQGIRTIADLGCGDFRIGRRIAEQAARYVGVDIVPELVDYYQRHYSDERISFQCCDITSDALPEAELCLVRQVLQHLSNAEVESALRNISRYRWAMVSEHVPVSPRSFNQDKPHGPDIRGYYGSGVYPDKPPFSRRASRVWETALEDGSVLRTVLLEQ